MGRKATYNRGREQRRQTQQFEAVHNAVKTLSSLQQSKALAKITLHDKLQVSVTSIKTPVSWLLLGDLDQELIC